MTATRTDKQWTVTMKTGASQWSIVKVNAPSHVEAIEQARNWVGGTFSEIV